MNIRFALVSSLVAMSSGCATTAPTELAQARPTPLVDVEDFAESHREAARSVTAFLAAQGERPKEFYADVETRAGGQVLVFHLWHQSAFEAQNREVVGNPGGKCRDVHYDIAARRVTQVLFWQ